MGNRHIFAFTISMLYIFVSVGQITCNEKLVPDFNSTKKVTIDPDPIASHEYFAQMGTARRLKMCRVVWNTIVSFGDYKDPDQKLSAHYFKIEGDEHVRPGILCSENPTVVIVNVDTRITGYLST